MTEKYVINHKVLFIPDENRLTSLEAKGREIILNAPVSRILHLLLQNARQVVPQEELFKEVWEKHGQFVSANTLYQNISLLRKGLNHMGLRTDTVRTVPKTGFIFKGKVQLHEDSHHASHQENINNQLINPFNDTIVNDEMTVKEANDQSITLPESQVENTNTIYVIFIKNWKGIKFISLIFFSFLLIVSILFLTKKDDKFISTHNKIANINQCAVYVDHGNLRASYEKYILFLKEKNIECSPPKFIYITKSIASHNVVILLCHIEVSESLKCSTLYNMT
ncbi:winged helix-turn-helix domain-containing protein [Serratia aquatilis]|uniref:Transcriptional regulator n=1 Tax=Serratia aquatilis TaxID=1737515 RepID=A0ABV6EH39_9GAMM